MTGEQKPGGLEVVAWFRQSAQNPDAWYQVDESELKWFRDRAVRVLPLPAEPAEARIRELEAENDVRKVEVIGLRAAIFGSHDYDPALRHGNFVEMARATEDGRQGALDRATAAEAKLARFETAAKIYRDDGDCQDFRDALASLQEAEGKA